MINLIWPEPLDECSDIHGPSRKEQLEPIKDFFRSRFNRTTKHRGALVIMGERKTGKTSLEKAIKGWLDEELPWSGSDSGYLALECQLGLGSFAEMQAQWLSELLNEDVESGPGQNYVSTYAKICAEEPGLRILICIDELDTQITYWSKHSASAESQRLLGFIEHIIEKTKLPIDFLITLTRTDIVASPYPSTFLDSANDVKLGLFDEADLKDLLTGVFGDQTSFRPAAISALFRASGGNPYIAKAILNCFLSPRLEPTKPEFDEPDVAYVAHILASAQDVSARDATPSWIWPEQIRRARENISVFLGRLLNLTSEEIEEAGESAIRHFSETEVRVLYKVALGDGQVTSTEVASWPIPERRAVRDLLAREYLILSADGKYANRISLLGAWLRQQTSPEDSSTHRQPASHVQSTSSGLVYYAVSSYKPPDTIEDRITLNGKLVKLTPTERHLASILFRNVSAMSGSGDLIEEAIPIRAGRLGGAVWPGYTYTKNNVQTYVRRLRLRLNDNAKMPRYVRQYTDGYLAQNYTYIVEEAP